MKEKSQEYNTGKTAPLLDEGKHITLLLPCLRVREYLAHQHDFNRITVKTEVHHCLSADDLHIHVRKNVTY